VDVVVDGFIHLQQYHVREIARGLSGSGTYRLRTEYPVCSALPPVQTFVVTPDEIVSTLQTYCFTNVHLFYLPHKAFLCKIRCRLGTFYSY